MQKQWNTGKMMQKPCSNNETKFKINENQGETMKNNEQQCKTMPKTNEKRLLERAAAKTKKIVKTIDIFSIWEYFF